VSVSAGFSHLFQMPMSVVLDFPELGRAGQGSGGTVYSKAL
jgi:hypothetical protein